MAGGSVVAAAVLGAQQDATFETYGKHWEEALFYSHALALPVFVLFRKSLFKVGRRWTVLKMKSVQCWALLLTNIACCHVAMSGIYKVTNETSSVTTTMGVTVRKFLSLLLSVFLFNRGSFGRNQWIGTGGVFSGSIFWALYKQWQAMRGSGANKSEVELSVSVQVPSTTKKKNVAPLHT